MDVRKSLAFMGAAAVLMASSAAQAAVVGFDDIPITGNDIQTSVTSAGYQFNGGHFHIIDSPDDRLVRNSSTSYLTAETGPGAGVTMILLGGGTFTLNQVDVAELWLPGDPSNDFLEVVITANQLGGGFLSMTVTLDGLRDGAGGVEDFQTVSMAGWTDLTDVTFTGRNAAGGFGDYSIDNIVVDRNDAPEPSGLALMALGGLALWARSRRRPGAAAA